jgi:uncharacterized membrane protein
VRNAKIKIRQTMNRPRIKIQPTTTDWVLEIVGLLGIIITIGFTLTWYNDLPDTIPRHYNSAGQPDGFSAKSILFTLATVPIVTYIILTVGLRFPHIFNYPFEITEENAERQYRNATQMVRVIKTFLVIIFGYLTYATIKNGLGEMQGLGIWFTPTTLVSVLGTIGYFIYQAFRLR